MITRPFSFQKNVWGTKKAKIQAWQKQIQVIFRPEQNKYWMKNGNGPN